MHGEQEIWAEAWTIIGGLQKENPPSTEQLRNLLSLLGELESARGEASTISAFFNSVGTGMVEAQESLDERSIQYNAGTPPQPSLFRIPKVDAEFHR